VFATIVDIRYRKTDRNKVKTDAIGPMPPQFSEGKHQERSDEKIHSGTCGRDKKRTVVAHISGVGFERKTYTSC